MAAAERCCCPVGVSCRPGEQPFGVTADEWAALCRSGVGAGGQVPERRKPRVDNHRAWEADHAAAIATFPVSVSNDVSQVGAPDPEPTSYHNVEDQSGAPVEEPTPAAETVTPAADNGPVGTTTSLVVVRELAPTDGRLFAVPEPVERPKRKPVDALSPSSASKLAQCPRQFEENKVLGRPEPSGRPAVIGKFVHKVLEWLTGLPLGERTEDKARGLAGGLWRDITVDPGSPVRGDLSDDDKADVVELRRDLVQLGETVAPKTFKGEAWAALAYAVSIEHDYGGEVAYRELRLWDTTVNGVPFRGKSDRIDRHRTVRKGLVNVDYKSGRAPLVEYVPRNAGPDAPKIGDVNQAKLAEKAEQLLWYWSPVEQKTGERVVGAFLAYIGAGAQVVLWVDEAQRPAAEAKLARLWRDLQRFETNAVRDGERYPAQPTPLCGWCPFFEDCRDGSQFLLDRWEKDEQRVTRWGKAPVPAHVEVRSWTRERRQAWQAFARAR